MAKGNPNHKPAGTPEGGEFAPKNDPNVVVSEPKEDKKKKTAGNKNFRKKKPVVVPKMEGGLEAMLERLKDLNSSISLGFLATTDEIFDNIEKFFPKQAINQILNIRNSVAISHHDKGYFHPESNHHVRLSLYTCVLGKYRYPDNHATLIKRDQYDKLSLDTGKYLKIYRGISSEGEKRKNILNGYLTANLNNISIYGNGVYGTNIYTTKDFSYAKSYADGDASKIIFGLLETDAKRVYSSELSNEQYNLRGSSSIKNKVVGKVTAHFEQNGADHDTAQDIADRFWYQLTRDISLLAILHGYDYQISDGGSQRNILNLKKWLIRE